MNMLSTLSSLDADTEKGCLSSIFLTPYFASKRAYAIPMSAESRAPAPKKVHCLLIPPQETLKHSSVSIFVGSLGPGAHKVRLSLLSISGEYVV